LDSCRLPEEIPVENLWKNLWWMSLRLDPMKAEDVTPIPIDSHQIQSILNDENGYHFNHLGISFIKKNK